MIEESFKIALVGENDVGKTNIISAFVYPFQESKSGGSFSIKYVVYDGGKILKLEIWDTAGQKRYRALTKMFYKDANAIILVYDITRKKSFEEIQTYWFGLIKQDCKKDIILAIAANNSDLNEKEEVDEEEARNFADKIGAIFASISTKNLDSINDLFINIVKKYTGSENIRIKDEYNDCQYQRQREKKTFHLGFLMKYQKL